jgi:hypothetical protein
VHPPPGAVDVAAGLVDVDHPRQRDQRLDQLLDVDQQVGHGRQHRADPSRSRAALRSGRRSTRRCGRPGCAGTPADAPPARAGSARTPRGRPPRPAPPRSSPHRSRSGVCAAGARPRWGSWRRGCRGPGDAPPGRGRAREITAAPAARVGKVIDDLVRVAGREQRRPTRAGLLTWASSAAPTRRPRRGHRRPVSRGRLGGVARDAAQPALQLRDLGLQLLDRAGLRLDQRAQFLTRRLLRPGHRT